MLDFYYGKLIKKFHPDLNGSRGSYNAMTKVINKLKSNSDVVGLKNLYERLV